ncbi:MAG: hypothetical protein JWN76_3602, partial [Chitinophagaceae bacterium]|nr:hypothetical protein [Chitinophagaceae bacterium]
MRKIYFLLFILFSIASFEARSQVVVSQIYGGGGNSGATYKNDFIELFNAGNSSVSVAGWSVQYASTTGTGWSKTDLSGTIPAHGYYLIQESAGTGGTTALPAPDATGSIAIAAGAGKVALLNTNILISSGISCPSGISLIDLVGFGNSTNCFKGSGPTPSPGNTTSVLRINNGCTDTNNNSSDFSTGTPTPRNTSSLINTCVVACTPPANQPTALNLSSTSQSINGNFTAAIGADNYLVLISTSNSLNQLPTSGTSYTPGATLGNAQVVSVNGTTFTATSLLSSTTYNFFIFSYNNTGKCFNINSPLKGVITTSASAVASFIISPPADFGNVCINTSASPNSFTIDGNNLNGTNIAIATISGFTFAESLAGPYSSTLSFSYTGNSFTAKQVYVKFFPAAVQSYNNNIIVSGGGVSSYTIPVTGSGINTAPTVTANSASGITSNAAILQGIISSNGCTAITAYGIEYSTVSGFTNGSGTQVSATNLIGGAFSINLTGLAANTIYFYKGFAVNSSGTSYSSQQSFATTAIPVVMNDLPFLSFTEGFDDVATWTNNFTSGNGASHFSSVPIGGSTTIPNASKITVSTSSFATGTSPGVQKGNENIILLTTGGTNAENSSSAAIDFYMDFTNVNAGTLSFDWASVNNSTGNRNGSLRVYASVNGTSFTELTDADVLNFTNNVLTSGSVVNVQLPASFNNNPNARIRFYYHNGTGDNANQTLSRPKISIDNLTVTAVSNTPCVTPVSQPTNLVFGNITDVSIEGSFTAASPSPNEYLVVMSSNSSLTSLPVDGQVYNLGDNIGDGAVVSKGRSLSFTATQLSGSTAYYFFIFPVNSVCLDGPKYSSDNLLTGSATTAAGIPPCASPADQPSGLSLNAVSSNTIHGAFTPNTANEFLVLRSTSASLTASPLAGQVYNSGDVIGNATVIQRSAAASFNASGLAPNTAYYFYVISLNSQGCINGPAYNTSTPLAASVSTLPLPACSTPAAQPTNLSFNTTNNSIAGTFNASGTDYNYLVIMSTQSSLSAFPVDNSDYNPGTGLGGGTVIANSAATSFTAGSLLNSTTYYFFVFSANKNCSGGTKYLSLSPLTGNTTTTNAPANNYYFGTLHSHSDYSDGNKDHPGFKPTDDYNYALGSQGMDFLGISEHNHFSSPDNPGNLIANYHSGITEAKNFTAAHPGFLALYGMEWGVISGGGHVVVYGDNMDKLFGWESNVGGTTGPNYDVFVPKSVYTGPTGLFKSVNDYVGKNTFATLAHPNNTDYNNLSNSAYDAVADSAIVGTAVESGPATSTNTSYSNPPSSMAYLWYYQKMLSRGYHLGPVIDHDNHNTTFGRTTYARTAVIAPALTQSDLVKAIRDMHFYATEDVDAKVDFNINSRMMGSVFTDRNAPAISVSLTDATTNTSNAVI